MENQGKPGAIFIGEGWRFPSESPVLTSSSQWLNDPLAREYFSRSGLRKNHPAYSVGDDTMQAVEIVSRHAERDIFRIEQLFTEERRRNRELDDWFNDSKIQDLSRDRLKTYPDRSLGNLLYRFCVVNDLGSDLTRDAPARCQLEFFMNHIGRTHDLEHLLGGFGFDYLGEQGVTWMRAGSYLQYLGPELAACVNMTYTLLLVPLLARTLIHHAECAKDVWDTMNQGLLVGRTSRPLFLMDYEPVMHLDLEEARERLGYRNAVEWDTRAAAEIWTGGETVPYDPRRDAAPIADTVGPPLIST